MDIHEIADQLVLMQEKKNNGRGVSCVRTVAQYLVLNMVTEAKAVCQNEWDKIRNYPDIAEFLNRHLVPNLR